MSVILKEGKIDKVIEAFSEVDKRYLYKLTIASCYFNPAEAHKLIKTVADTINIESIEIYIDRNEATKIGKEKLKNFINKSTKKIPTYLSAITTSKLFHPKIYALTNDNDETPGCLVIGSANLTGAGLTRSGGNIETLLETYDEETIDNFLEDIANLKTIQVCDLEKFSRINNRFKFALLHKGVFFHKWQAKLSEIFAKKYELTPSAASKLGDDVLKNLNFNIETSSIQKQYFKLQHLEELRNEIIDRNFTRNYGVETYLGTWVPKSILNNKDIAFKNFKEQLAVSINEQWDTVKYKIQKDWEELSAKNYISEKEDPTEKLRQKIDQSLKDDEKLLRIYQKYYIFELPYDFTNQDDVSKVYESLLSTINSRRNKNITMKYVEEAIETRDLSNI